MDRLQGRTIAEITFPEDWAKEREAIGALLASGAETCSVEKRYRGSSDRPIWVRVWIFRYNPQTQLGPLLCGLVEDISDRKRVEHDLLESEARFHDLFEHARHQR